MAGFLFFFAIGQFMESAMPNVLTFPLVNKISKYTRYLNLNLRIIYFYN
jgi:hypothetical protein